MVCESYLNEAVTPKIEGCHLNMMELLTYMKKACTDTCYNVDKPWQLSQHVRRQNPSEKRMAKWDCRAPRQGLICTQTVILYKLEKLSPDLGTGLGFLSYTHTSILQLNNPSPRLFPLGKICRHWETIGMRKAEPAIRNWPHQNHRTQANLAVISQSWLFIRLTQGVHLTICLDFNIDCWTPQCRHSESIDPRDTQESYTF